MCICVLGLVCGVCVRSVVCGMWCMWGMCGGGGCVCLCVGTGVCVFVMCVVWGVVGGVVPDARDGG